MCGNNCSEYGSGVVDIGLVVVEDSTTTTSSSLNYTEHLQATRKTYTVVL